MSVGGGIGGSVTSGTLTWTFDTSSLPDGNQDAFDHLAVGESVVLDYTIRADDGSGGGTATADQVVRITITGSNDAPTVDGGLSNQSATENAAFSYGVPSSAFADLDGSDSLTFTATLSGGGALPGWLSFDGTTFTGTPDDSDVDGGPYVIAVTASDGNGGSVTTSFTIAMVDVNNAATITVDGGSGDSASGGVGEDGTLVVSGTVSVSDADGGEDRLSTTLVADGTYGSLVVTDAAAGEWTYTLANGNGAVQGLGAGQTLVDTMTVQSFDGTASQVITITITGANDGPTIGVVASGDGSSASVTEDGTLVASDTLTIGDIDVLNTATVAVQSVAVNVSSTGTAGSVTAGALAAMLSVTGGTTSDAASISNAETSDQVTWTFDPGVEGFDHLDAGETLVLDYTVRVTDSAGSSADQLVTVTVTGTEDGAVFGGD
ncbi:MAG: VCBS domain-containing protein, partial [Cyanobacteria bacterium J06553_1]